MQFLLIGRDGEDESAMDRRLAARQAHIDMGDDLFKSGNMWYGAAITNDKGEMKGSALFMDFDTKEDLDAWLEKEPYVTGKVWESVEIIPCNTRDPWQFNRPKEFFVSKDKTGGSL